MKKNVNQDPNSLIGIELGKKSMQIVNSIYGKKYAHLRTKKWEKGFGEGKGLDEVGLTPQLVAWLDKAMDAYWRDRIYGILVQVGNTSSDEVLALWNEVLDDMYGEQIERKKDTLLAALDDQKVSQKAKQWLRSLI